MQKVNPKIALIGVGNNNLFGHPSEEVRNRLQSQNTKIFRTDLNGEIEMKIDKNGKMYILSKFDQ